MSREYSHLLYLCFTFHFIIKRNVLINPCIKLRLFYNFDSIKCSKMSPILLIGHCIDEKFKTVKFVPRKAGTVKHLFTVEFGGNICSKSGFCLFTCCIFKMNKTIFGNLKSTISKIRDVSSFFNYTQIAYRIRIYRVGLHFRPPLVNI